MNPEVEKSQQERDYTLTPSIENIHPDDSTATDLEPILAQGAKEISVPLSAEHISAFSKFTSLLREWNQKMNLTNIIDDEGIAMRHFIDSLTLVSHLQNEQKKQKKEDLQLLDVGSGAGMPGIPLRLAMPELRVTLLDSLKKRVGFLEHACKSLAIDDVRVIASRAEDAGHLKQYREQFDIVTARAVAELQVLIEYCMPFVKPGGIFLAMKGQVEEEANVARKAIILLGGTIEEIHSFVLPGTDVERAIIVIRKLRNTPPSYPRKAGTPKKRPL